MDRDFPTRDRWACLLVAATAFSCPTWAAGPTAEFHVSAGHAPQTLREFYLQSQVRVLYLADTVKGVETQAVTGQFEASDALAQMLQGTGLTYEFDGEYSVLIKPAPDVAAALSASTAAPGAGPIIPLSPLSATDKPAKVEEVLVTGSLIHGVFDIASPLLAVENKQLKRTPYAAVQDAVQSLPLAASISRGEVLGGDGNANHGSGINLRGLGDGATLVLVNGRRQPMAGARGDFVDVSNIPWSMVERIEVLPDGGSALYGSDAIAGVVNVLLRENLDGAESQLRYGAAPDGATELLASQLLGRRWDSGHWLAGYQYYERSSLAAADRSYTANTDKRALGGRDFSSVASNPGNILDPDTQQPLFAIPRGQDGTSLTASDLLPGVVNYRNYFADAQLLPDKSMHTLYFTGSQALSEGLELFVEGRYAYREHRLRPWSVDGGEYPLLVVPDSNPYFVDAYGGASYVIVAYDFANELGPLREHGTTRSYLGTMGMNAQLGGAWQGSVSASYGAEDLRHTTYGNVNSTALNSALADPDPATAFNPFGDGVQNNPATLEAIHLIVRRTARSEIASLQLAADGPVLALPSGMAKMAVGAEYREEMLTQTTDYEGVPLPNRVRVGRKVSAIFSELSVPLISSPVDPQAPPRLELSLAGRFEQYDDFGRTFNPKLGLRWTPLASLKLRASWGTSFRAPTLIDLDDSRNTASLESLADPRSPTGRSDILGLQGGNPDLKEERASTWTAGLDLAPSAWPGLQLSLTGYSIHYEDQVIQPGPSNPYEILYQEDQWASVITRNPSQAQIDAICNSPQFVSDPQQCNTLSPTVIVDIRKHNLAITKVQGLDFTLRQSFVTDAGHWYLEANGTRVFHFKQAFTKTSPLIDVVDTVENALALRVRGSVEWYRHGRQQPGLGVSLSASYTGGYRDPDSSVHGTVGSWTTWDFGLSYRTGERGDWADNTSLVLNVTNVLDEDPPFVDRSWGYDWFNAQPSGRVASFYVSKAW